MTRLRSCGPGPRACHHAVGQGNPPKAGGPSVSLHLRTSPSEREDGGQSLFPFLQFNLWNFSAGAEENYICYKWKKLN